MDAIAEIMLALPDDVLGELARDLTEAATGSRHKKSDAAERVLRAVGELRRHPESEALIRDIAARAPSRARRKYVRGEQAGDVVARAFPLQGGAETWSALLLGRVDLTPYSDGAIACFEAFMGEVAAAAAGQWSDLLSAGSCAVAELVARTVQTENARAKKQLSEEVRSYLFTSQPATMSGDDPFRSHLLTCDNCGQNIGADALRPTRAAGIYACTCPACGAALSFGHFSEAGSNWAAQCLRGMDALLGEVQASRLENREEHRKTREALSSGNADILREIKDLKRELGRSVPRQGQTGSSAPAQVSPETPPQTPVSETRVSKKREKRGKGARVRAFIRRHFSAAALVWVLTAVLFILVFPIIAMPYQEDFDESLWVWILLLAVEGIAGIGAFIAAGSVFDWDWFGDGDYVFNPMLGVWLAVWLLPFTVMALVVTFAPGIDLIAAHWGILAGAGGALSLFASPFLVFSYDDITEPVSIALLICSLLLILAFSMPVYVAAVL